MSSSIGNLKLGAYDGQSSTDLIGNGDPIYDKYATRKSLNSEWKVFVIDIEKLGQVEDFNFYAANNADLRSASFGLQVGYNHTGTFDVAYFAVCDNWSEVKSVVGDEAVVLTNWVTVGNDVTLTPADVDNKVAAESAK
jgi:hypothetical protein